MEQELNFDEPGDVQRSRDGDHVAFSRLVYRYIGLVHAIAFARLNHDSDQADELTQEVFLRAWLQLDKLSRPEYFPAWLAQITRNLAGDWIRRDRRKSALVQLVSMDNPETASIPSEKPTPQESQMQNEDARGIYAALQKLPADQRELLLLHYCENLTQSDIARRLHVHPSTIMRKLDQALKRLRTLYLEEPATALRARAQNHDPLKHRMATILAATCALSAPQRKTLAASTAQSFPITDLRPYLNQSFITTKGKIMTASAVVLIIASMFAYLNGTGSLSNYTIKTINSVYHTGLTHISVLHDRTNRAESRRFKIQNREILLNSSPKPVLSATISHNHETTNPLISSRVSPEDINIGKNTKRLPSLGTLSGQLLTPKNVPIASVEIAVSALVPAEQSLTFPKPAHGKTGRILTFNNLPEYQTRKGITDAQGRFTFDFDKTGTALIEINQKSYARLLQVVELPGKNVEIKLTDKGATAHGAVFNLATGEPEVHALVDIHPYVPVKWAMNDQTDTPTIDLYSRGSVTAITDENGIYRVNRMASSSLDITARNQAELSVPMWLISKEKAVIKKEQDSVLPDIFMFPGYAIRGTILDKKTQLPVSGVRISLKYGSNSSLETDTQTVVTDEKGHYEIKEFPFRRSQELPTVTSILPPLIAEKGGYQQFTGTPKQTGTFDPKHLDLQFDFDLTPTELPAK